MSDLNDPSQTDLDTASSRVDAHQTLSLLGNMLPRVLASDERDARRYVALQRRWRRIPWSGPEIEQELKTFLAHLSIQLSQSAEGLNKVLSTPAQALLYIERAAFYALQDYPNEFEQYPQIQRLCDLLSGIHRDARAWCKTEPQDDGQILGV